MFSTEEDMKELDRSILLLRKGYLVQKGAVSDRVLLLLRCDQIFFTPFKGCQQLVEIVQRAQCERPLAASGDQFNDQLGHSSVE